MSEKSGYNWIVSQIGARQHYAVPRAFQLHGRLEVFYTELWCRWGASLLKRGPKALRAFAGRHHADLPSSKVVAFNWHSLTRRHASAGSTEEEFLEHKKIGEEFAGLVNRSLERKQLDPMRDVFFGFDTGCLETIRMFKERGHVTIVDQIDPGRVEEEIVVAESRKWAGWQKVPGRIPDAYYQRLSAEWEEASLVLVNSQWTRQALVKQGVKDGKIIVVPQAFEAQGEEATIKHNPDRALTVLWIGSVILRKGIQYLIEAARELKDENVKFVIAGPVGISPEAVATAPANMQFLGRVTRNQTAELYREGDVFVLPTLSDGFAMTQLEAMARAMPVITTPNCGEVVTDGLDGLIVPACDSRELARAIGRLAGDRKLLAEMSRAAVEKSTRFSLKVYCQRVEAAVGSLRGD